MDNLLKILPLLNMPETVRQPLLLDALAGKGNAMVGFIAARQASGKAAQEDPATTQNIKNDAAAILAHLYRQANTTDADWAARLAALRTAIEASETDDDQAHLQAFAAATGSSSEAFLIQYLHQPAAIDPAIVRDLQSITLETAHLIERLAFRHKSSMRGADVPAEKIRMEFKFAPISGQPPKNKKPAAQIDAKASRKTTVGTRRSRKKPG